MDGGRWAYRRRPEVMVEGSGSGAAPHETMEGSGSGAAPGSDAAPREAMEGSSSGAAPHETMEGSGSGAAPHEVSPLPRSRGQARNGPAQMTWSRDLGVRPQNVPTAQQRQSKSSIPLFFLFSVF